MLILNFSKCALNHLTIQQNDIVCSSRDLDSYDTCDMGKIIYLYEDLSNRKPQSFALIQWYSR